VYFNGYRVIRVRKKLGGNMPAKRINIPIPDEDKLWLNGYAKVQKISVAEAIHRGICLLKKRERQETY
jgi:hypothetical protein